MLKEETRVVGHTFLDASKSNPRKAKQRHKGATAEGALPSGALASFSPHFWSPLHLRCTVGAERAAWLWGSASHARHENAQRTPRWSEIAAQSPVMADNQGTSVDFFAENARLWGVECEGGKRSTGCCEIEMEISNRSKSTSGLRSGLKTGKETWTQSQELGLSR